MREFGGIIDLNNKNVSHLDKTKLTSHILKRGILAEKNYDNFYAYQLNFDEELSIFEDKLNKKIVILNGRIDNKEAIKSKLGLKDNDANDEVIFHKSYLKWGNQLGSHIIGSFVCLLFDRYKNKGIIIKDHIGSKPLYFSFINKRLVFSNNITAIKNSSQKADDINQDRIRDYVIYLHGKSGDTFYKNIKKLQRAEILTIESENIAIKKYFRFNTNRVSSFKDINECKEAFEELFIKVIKEQSHGLEKVGSKLSGGIDSSSITAILAEYSDAETISYSALFKNLNIEDFKKTDEKEFMDSIIEHSKIQNKKVYIDSLQINPFAYLDDSEYSEVTPHANRYFEVLLLEAASKDGIKVLFDGFDGDSVLSYGYEYLNELGSKFNLFKLIDEAKKLSKNKSVRSIFKEHVLIPYLPDNVISRIRFYKNKDYFQNRLKILKNGKHFLDELQYNKHFGRKKVNKRNVQEMHNATLDWPIWEVAMEFSYIDSSKFGIEERYPFFDRRIMEFCLAVPGKYRLHQGISRYYFRESMRGHLPKKNIERLSKGNISPLIVNYLKRNINELEKQIFTDINSELIDHDILRKNFVEPFKKGYRQEVNSQLIFQIIALNKWLKKLNK